LFRAEGPLRHEHEDAMQDIDINAITHRIADLRGRVDALRGYL